MSEQKRFGLIAIVVLVSLLAACGSPAAPTASAGATVPAPQPTTAAAAPARVLTLAEFDGTVQVKTAGGSFAPATKGQTLAEGTEVQTDKASHAVLSIEDGTQTVLGPDTSLLVKTLAGTAAVPVTLFSLLQGDVHTFHTGALPAGAAFTVETPKGDASFQHSKLSVSYNKETGKTTITCLEGACSLQKGDQTVNLEAGQAIAVTGVNFDQSFVREMTQEELQAWINQAAACGCLNNAEVEAIQKQESEAPTEAPEATTESGGEPTVEATAEATSDNAEATPEATSDGGGSAPEATPAS